MAGVYRPRHPERTVLYRVLFHYFDRFLAEYEGRFEKEYGFLRPISSLAAVSTATSRLSKAVVTGVDVLTYHPSRWLKRQTGPEMLTRPARPKSKLLSIERRDLSLSDALAVCAGGHRERRDISSADGRKYWGMFHCTLQDKELGQAEIWQGMISS